MRISFGGGNFDSPDLVRSNVEDQLEETERLAGLEPGPVDTAARLQELIEALHERTGQRAVVLVDEYDKPILDALGDRELALANCNFLRDLYWTIKDCDERLRFVFLTGVSKLAGIFSGLNNLRHAGAGVLGHLRLHGRGSGRGLRSGTQGPGPGEGPALVQRLQLARRGQALQPVRRPPSLRNARVQGALVPERHADLPRRPSVAAPALEGLVANDELLSAFDVDDTEALLFQTGYLTIVGEEAADGGSLYRLGYPNYEVKLSLNKRLLRAMAPTTGQVTRQAELGRLTAEDDPEKVRALFEAFFASVPHDRHRKNGIAHYEGYWAALVYSHFAAAGLDVRVEEATARGRLDMAVLGRVHLYEFKVVDRGQEGRALAQMRERGYADKYRHLGVPADRHGVRPGRTQHRRVRDRLKPETANGRVR